MLQTRKPDSVCSRFRGNDAIIYLSRRLLFGINLPTLQRFLPPKAGGMTRAASSLVYVAFQHARFTR